MSGSEPEIIYSEEGIIERFADPQKQVHYEHLLHQLGSIAVSPQSKLLPAETIAKMEDMVTKQIEELIEGTDTWGNMAAHAIQARLFAYGNEAGDTGFARNLPA